jgi:hypothetical protein
MNQLVFSARATGPDLALTVRFNGQVYHGNLVESRIFSFEFSDLGQHILEIELANKLPRHTVVRIGEIISDQVVEIGNFAINGIEIDSIIPQCAVYWHNNNQPGQLNPDEFYGVMGCNGRIELSFASPIRNWLIAQGVDVPVQQPRSTVWSCIRAQSARLGVATGIDLAKFAEFIFNIPRYLADLMEYHRRGGDVERVYPMLHDRQDQAGAAAGSYFCQDLHVANLVYQAQPVRHVTVGSVLSGFVAHVASFRPITVWDRRPLDLVGHPNIEFECYDLLGTVPAEVSDSVSCLSTMHHLGTGRYGGEITTQGPERGMSNLVRMLKPQGTLYIGVALNHHDRTIFNSGRAFNPRTPLTWYSGSDLSLHQFDWVDPRGVLHTDQDPGNPDLALDGSYGIYTFKKSWKNAN